jgi:hypothetical protein
MAATLQQIVDAYGDLILKLTQEPTQEYTVMGRTWKAKDLPRLTDTYLKLQERLAAQGSSQFFLAEPFER